MPKKDILAINDISEYVKRQYQFVLANELDKLELLEEKPYIPVNAGVSKRLKID